MFEIKDQKQVETIVNPNIIIKVIRNIGVSLPQNVTDKIGVSLPNNATYKIQKEPVI